MKLKFKLVCFDLDGCLTEKDDSWSFIHRHLGVWEQAKKHRKLFFDGKINYQEWANLDIGLWKNISLEKLKKIIKKIKVRPNIKKMVRELKKKKLILLILSSGLSFFADIIKKNFHFDYAIANSPEIGDDGKLTGEIKVEISYNDKHLVLQEFIAPYKIKLEECIAVGDGENDIALFEAVGYCIAFNPISEKVAKSADIVVQNGDLQDVLTLILAKL